MSKLKTSQLKVQTFRKWEWQRQALRIKLFVVYTKQAVLMLQIFLLIKVMSPQLLGQTMARVVKPYRMWSRKLRGIL